MLTRGVLLVFFTLLSISTQAGTVNLLGRQVEVVMPSGYCELGMHPSDADLIRRLNVIHGINGNESQTLSTFADCKELEDLRNGKRLRVANYGTIYVPTPNGQIPVMKGITRSEFIQAAKQDGQSVTDNALKTFESRVRERLPSLQVRSIALLRIDSNGAYYGALVSYTDDKGKPGQSVSIMGATLVKELPVFINLVQVYTKSPDIRGLLSRQQAAIAQFVHANESLQK